MPLQLASYGSSWAMIYTSCPAQIQAGARCAPLLRPVRSCAGLMCLSAGLLLDE